MIIDKEIFLYHLYRHREQGECRSILTAGHDSFSGDANWLRVGTWKTADRLERCVIIVYLTPENKFLVLKTHGRYSVYCGNKEDIYCRTEDITALKNFLGEYFEDVVIGQKGRNNQELIYIAGPMNGHPDWNYDSFHQAEKEILQQGYRVVNPARLCPIDGLEKDQSKGQNGRFSTAMRTCLKVMLNCSAVALLPGWEKSRGATLERYIADHLYIPVYMIDNLLGKLNPDGTEKPKTPCNAQAYWQHGLEAIIVPDPRIKQMAEIMTEGIDKFMKEISKEAYKPIDPPDPNKEKAVTALNIRLNEDLKSALKKYATSKKTELVEPPFLFSAPSRKISFEIDACSENREALEDLKVAFESNNVLKRQEQEQASTKINLALDGAPVHPTQAKAYEQIAKYRHFTARLAEQILYYLIGNPYIMQKSVLFAVGALNIELPKKGMSMEALVEMQDDIQTILRNSEAIYEHFQRFEHEYYKNPQDKFNKE